MSEEMTDRQKHEAIEMIEEAIKTCADRSREKGGFVFRQLGFALEAILLLIDAREDHSNV